MDSLYNYEDIRYANLICLDWNSLGIINEQTQKNICDYLANTFETEDICIKGNFLYINETTQYSIDDLLNLIHFIDTEEIIEDE